MDAWFALVFLITWIAPDTFGEKTVHQLTFVMLVEFIVVHSAAFMGAVATRDATPLARAAQFTGLTALYTIFALGFSALYGALWPVFAFWLLMLSRFPTVVLRPPDFRGQFVLMANWAAMAVLYLVGTGITATSAIPQLGITPEVIAAQEFDMGGLWPEEPYRVMAFGTFYFAGLAVLAVINEGIAIAATWHKTRKAVRTEEA